jgi:hypothetical protein
LAKVIIEVIPVEDGNSTLIGSHTDENGIFIIGNLPQNFYFNFLYAESEKGFIFLERQELEIYKNLNSFEIKLKLGNFLKVKIENLEEKKEPYDLFIRFKNGAISEKISFGEEKIYKNLISPIEIEILFEGATIWKEKLELKEGENIIVI